MKLYLIAIKWWEQIQILGSPLVEQAIDLKTNTKKLEMLKLRDSIPKSVRKSLEILSLSLFILTVDKNLNWFYTPQILELTLLAGTLSCRNQEDNTKLVLKELT